jgi:2-polyprenyl-6-methoxyphenol hydroxylase-like FAD-dependent oxidoreductase
MNVYDVVIVGARCAGASTAMLLARAGARVLLLDRAEFPSDTVSTHFLHPAGAALLEEWGLLEPLLATGCPPISRMTFDLAPDVRVSGAVLPAGAVTAGVAPRRIVLDDLLLRAAVQAGAEFRSPASFRDVVWDGDRVAGVRFSSDGREFTEQTLLVLGADGKHSAVAKAVDAKVYGDLGVISCLYYGYWSGLEDRGSQVFISDRTAAVAFPTNDGAHCVVVGWPRSRFEEVRRDIDRHFGHAVDRLAPQLAAEMRAGVQTGRVVGSGDLPNFYRVSAGPGWGLLGDAGLVKDPASAHGIGDAFWHSALLASRVGAVLGEGPQSVDRAVAEVAALRDAETADRFATNAAFAEWAVPGPLLEVLREAQHDPARVTQFLGVYAGRVPLAEFMGAP